MYSNKRAARRFYDAFYCWNRLRATPSCLRFVSITKHPAAADGPLYRKTDAPLSRKQSDGATVQRNESSSEHISDDGTKEIPMRRHVHKLPLLSSTEKPFDTFKVWERVVRYRSDSGALLQVAVPQSTVRDMQETHGPKLLALPGNHARMELGPKATTAGQPIQSLAVSGTYSELHRTLSFLWDFKEPKYLSSDPVPLSRRPSEAIEPWERVLRGRETNYCEVETSIPARKWQSLQRTMGLGIIKNRHGTKIVAGSTMSHAFSASSGTNARSFQMQSILVSGVPLKVHYTVNDIAVHRESQAERSTEQTTCKPTDGPRSEVEAEAPIDTAMPYLIVSVPKGADGETVARDSIVHKHNARIKECRIQVENGGAYVRICGPSGIKIRNAFSHLQGITRVACNKAGIPPVRLQKLESNMNTTEQKPENDSSPVAASVAPHSAGQRALTHRETLEPRQDSSKDVLQECPSEDMRRALRALSHPVVLVTSQVSHGSTPSRRLQSVNDRIPFCRGLTVSSFNSITLNPDVMVSFNIRVPSRTWDAISASRSLAAHFLAASPAGAALAHEFTLPHERPDDAFWNVRRMGAHLSVPRNDRFAPRIRLAGAVMATVRATLDKEKSVRVGDHMIVVAKVDKVEFPDEADEKALSEANVTANCLTYAQRAYRSVGKDIEPIKIPEAESQAQQASTGKSQSQDESSQEQRQATAQLDKEMIGSLDTADAERDSVESKSANAPSPEQTEIEYFEAIEGDKLEYAVANTAQSHSTRQDVLREEEEYDFGFAAVEEEGPVGISPQSEPFMGGSAAAREKEEAEDSDPAGLREAEKAEEQDAREETQKRRVLNADNT